MPSKLEKAIGAVKDQTSISLAKVVNTNSASLEVAVLKATTHDQGPIDERYVKEILRTISSNKLYAAITAHIISKRIAKTKNWVVALKSLMLVLRIFQEGDPFFPQEVLNARNRGAKILNLSTFRDDSNSSPYDFTAFVRSFAFYLEDRLDCFLTGKLLEGRFAFKERQSNRVDRLNQQPVRQMKPPMLLDRIFYWQRLLDRVIATKPSGAAKINRLVLACLYAVVRESFDLYRDISDGVGLLLDSFFHLQHQSCVNVFQHCVKATRQFEELSSFYDYCKSLGIGRTSEYPSVQKISDELMETLQEFLKDQASFPSPEQSSSSYSPRSLHPPVPAANDPSGTSASESQAASRCRSMEDLTSQIESVEIETISPSFSVGNFSELSEKQCHEKEDMYNVTETGSNHSLPMDQRTLDFVSIVDWSALDKTQGQKSSAMSDSTKAEAPLQASQYIANDHFSFHNWKQQDHKQEQASQNGAERHSYINDWLQEYQQQDQQASHSEADDRSYFGDWLGKDKQEPEEEQQNLVSSWSSDGKEGWEHVLAEAATEPAQGSQHLANGIEPPIVPPRQYNPFLDDEIDISASIATTANEKNIAAFPDEFSMAPTFQATPTFFAQSPNQMAKPTFQAVSTSSSQNPNRTTEAFQDDEFDPFAPWPTTEANCKFSSDGCIDQQNMLLQQELWLQNQNKILERHIV